jgi:2,3,4,5-tetrahydropyridine-2-carboxylate N-succinyltransferase
VVLEPLQAAIMDGAFIGSRCIVVEGVHVGKAVLGANVCLTASTKIIDVTGETPVEMKVCSCPFSSDSR